MGYSQKEGIDFLKSSPIAKLAMVKMLLVLATSHNWILTQLDVNNAFLNGDLFEEVYMTLPLGYQPQGELLQGSNKHICKLSKSIYGL